MNNCENKCWSLSILNDKNWESGEELVSFLKEISDAKYEENNLDPKSIFIGRITRLIRQIEFAGDIVRETRQMVTPGSIFESLSSDYLSIRNDYLRKRRELKKHLIIINSYLK